MQQPEHRTSLLAPLQPPAVSANQAQQPFAALPPLPLLLTPAVGDDSASSSCRMVAECAPCSAAAEDGQRGSTCLSGSRRVLCSRACSCCCAAVLSGAAGS
eukprot:GHRQ01017852.1.p3 GENE.GHRQ01017852.1~~GHRQ01017852.1.p3  ORF type:complete len:101 (+),score=34.96 GHRQ01017852.1:643-945(+)